MNVLEKAESLQKQFAETRNPDVGKQAADAWCDALAVDIDNPIAMANLAAVLQELGMSGLAACVYNRALAIDHRIPDAWSNLGGIYRNLSYKDRAEQCFREALTLNPARPAGFLNNLVTCYINSGRPEEGLEIVEEGLAKEPDNLHLKWNKGLLLLELGQWDKGFELYESGLELDERMRREYGEVPVWDGAPIDDGYLVIYGEQGLGDEIMYASAIKDALAICPKIILDIHPRLITLFRESFPEIEFLYPTRKKDTITWLGNHPNIKARCAMGSLFYHFRRDGYFPKERYIRLDGSLYRKKLERIRAMNTGNGPVIGIGWIGGSPKTNKVGRSVKLSDMKPVFDAFPSALFLSFQYTPEAREKVIRYRKQTGVNIHHLDEAYMDDYMHTACALQCVNFVVSPNTTLVHLCGAMGIECYVFTPKERAWRYYGVGDESDMVFYGPWVKQFHQKVNETPAERLLTDVVARVAQSAREDYEKNHIIELETCQQLRSAQQ